MSRSVTDAQGVRAPSTRVAAAQPASNRYPIVHTDSDKIRDRYSSILADSADASVYQTIEWLSIFKTLSADLVFVEMGADVLLPFVCRGRGVMRRAYSLPYDTYGGPVAVTAAPMTFTQITSALMAPTMRVVDYAGNVELNGSQGEARDVATYIVALDSDYDTIFKRYADTNQRLIRQSGERGLRISTLEDEDQLKIVHRLHVRTMKRYRTEGFPLDFFVALYRNLIPAGLGTIYLAWHKDEVIGANIVLRYGSSAYDWMWVYNEEYAHVRPTNAMIDRAIEDEVARGARQFNLGASPDERMGSVRFKKSFGAESQAYRIFYRNATFHRVGRSVKRSIAALKRKGNSDT